MKIRALDVSEANSYIKRILINDPILCNLKIKGEISNFKVHSSGNVYLSLKDQNSKINCVIFRNDYDRNLNLENGTKVIASGYISVYERDGSYQLYIKHIEIAGIGNLYIEFNKLKEKLQKEGLFDYKYKKPIPKIPKSIGVVTSPTGAVIRDIINVTKRRYPKVHIKLYPVKVQGEGAKDEICEGIRFFNEIHKVDTIIIGRGGGSIEDLWAFNEEPVIEAVFNSNTPVISAVGHETDFTITDFVADLRAPTPSAAAELAVSDISVTQSRIEGYMELLNQLMERKLYMYRSQLENKKLKLEHLSPMTILDSRRHQLIQTGQRMENAMNNILLSRKHQLEIYASKLHGLSPLEKLSQGYSYVESIQGKPVNSVKNIDAGDKVKIYFKDGNVDAQVLEVNNGKISDN